MKTTLTQALNLAKEEFIAKMISLNQDKVMKTLDSDLTLKSKYQDKVVEIYNEDIAHQDFFRKVEFGESKALLSLLNLNQKGWVLYFACIRGGSFKAAYNAVELGFQDNNNIKKFFPNLVFDEVNRLANGENFPHLENNIDYLGFIDKAYKPYISHEIYTFMLYASFVHHVKNGFNINNQHMLNLVGMQADNEMKKYKKQYYHNCMSLIEKYQEKLHFELWTPQLLGLLHKDIKTPFPYHNTSFSNQTYELEQFAPYGEVLGKFLMKDNFDKKFPEKQNNHAKVKI